MKRAGEAAEQGSPFKVLLLAGADSIHVQRWVEALAGRGLAVTLVSQTPPGAWRIPATVSFYLLPIQGGLGYFANAPALRRIVRRVRPDLLNAHYASGYGTLAGIIGYKPTLLSVWGSDVYDFPYQSWITSRLIRWNLHRAQRIASTSRAMATQVRTLLHDLRDIEITPFGVDCQSFRPIPGLRDERHFTIGTIKTLDHKYGLDVLLRAFARLTSDPLLKSSGLSGRLRLLLVGDGPERGKLEGLARDVGVAHLTTFAGGVPHTQVPMWLNRLHVYAAASRIESFGVAVIEASACGLPVVVSDAGGLPEVVLPDSTGLIVAREDPVALHAALARLALDPPLRQRLGAAGREHVRRAYAWDACVDRMLEVYDGVVRDFPTS